MLLLSVIKDGKYRVTEVFRRFMTWERFQNHVTQNRQVATDYSVLTYDNVMIFEFFMPLTNEGFFFKLFVQSIVLIVNGEDEIWMLESGMRSRLHIWRIQE